jgi:hypothetical protein
VGRPGFESDSAGDGSEEEESESSVQTLEAFVDAAEA